MKRFAMVLAGLLVLPAFAEVAPAGYYDDVIEFEDPDFVEEEVVLEEDTAPAPAPSAVVANPRSATGVRAQASRSVPMAATSGATATTSATGRSMASRNVSQRGNSSVANTARTATNGAAAGRAANRTTASRGVATTSVSRGGMNTNSVATRSTGVSARRTNTSAQGTAARAGTLTQTDTVNSPLYIGSSGSRVGVRTSSASISARVPAIRVSSGSVTADVKTTVEAVAETADDLDALAQLTDYCKAQYTQCMDNFCNVLDDNQGRCSCSANLKNYEKTEAALKTATEELQDVAQKIQYIGLTKDEIEVLFTQTEAELQMSKTTDSTQLKNDLDRIKKLIVDVKSGTATVEDGYISMDLSNLLDFTITSTGFDLGSLFSIGTGNTASISNQRGETLYKTAASRCKAAVLNTCANQGVDVSIISNAYDMEIDKQCIAYERNLSDSNDQMLSTVRNAKNVLQKARLLVEQQKNQYDLRGCVNALDSCMQDEYVCGTDYESCLDPTGKYIVNGEIVIGSEPGLAGGNFNSASSSTIEKVENGLYTAWNYSSESKNATTFNKNAWSTTGSLGEFITQMMPDNYPKNNNTNDMVKYIVRKIGNIDSDGKVEGMCASVLNRCQNYTYDTTTRKTGKAYKLDNEVVRAYLERMLVQVKASQDTILSDYAEGCIADVASCISSAQNTGYYQQLDNDSILDSAIAACRPYIKTCRSVTSYGDVNDTDRNWVKDVLGIYANAISVCVQSGGKPEVKSVTKSSETTQKTELTVECDCSADSTLQQNAAKTACVKKTSS